MSDNLDGCTERNCHRCNTPAALRTADMHHAGISSAPLPSSQAASDARDAERWREVLTHISLMLSGGRRIVWSVDDLSIPSGTHFYGPEAANPEVLFVQQIDAAILAKANGGAW